MNGKDRHNTEIKHQGQDLGPCPICGRILIDGPSVNRHHWIPQSKAKKYGGKADNPWSYIHKVCHKKIHAVFSEKSLGEYYNTPERLCAADDMQKFIKFIRKQPPEADLKMRKPKLGKK